MTLEFLRDIDLAAKPFRLPCYQSCKSSPARRQSGVLRRRYAHDNAQAGAHRRLAMGNDPALARYDAEHDQIQYASPQGPRLDPSAIRSSFAQAPTAEGLNHVYENGAGVGQPGPVPVARDGWLAALIVATDWNNFAPRVGIAYSPNSRRRSSGRLANSPPPGACAVNAWRPIPTLAVS
jgi:hypothetical protein